jgi:hypothetical protein
MCCTTPEKINKTKKILVVDLKLRELNVELIHVPPLSIIYLSDPFYIYIIKDRKRPKGLPSCFDSCFWSSLVILPFPKTLRPVLILGKIIKMKWLFLWISVGKLSDYRLLKIHRPSSIELFLTAYLPIKKSKIELNIFSKLM